MRLTPTETLRAAALTVGADPSITLDDIAAACELAAVCVVDEAPVRCDEVTTSDSARVVALDDVGGRGDRRAIVARWAALLGHDPGALYVVRVA